MPLNWFLKDIELEFQMGLKKKKYLLIESDLPRNISTQFFSKPNICFEGLYRLVHSFIVFELVCQVRAALKV